MLRSYANQTHSAMNSAYTAICAGIVVGGEGVSSSQSYRLPPALRTHSAPLAFVATMTNPESSSSSATGNDHGWLHPYVRSVSDSVPIPRSPSGSETSTPASSPPQSPSRVSLPSTGARKQVDQARFLRNFESWS